MIDNLKDEPSSPVPTPLATKLKALIDAVSIIGPLNFLPDHLSQEDEHAIVAATEVVERLLAERQNPPR